MTIYIPKHCPECGEGRHLFVEVKPNYIGCQNCGMEFKVDLLFDVDAETKDEEIKQSCENCGTKEKHGCSFYTARDCGSSFGLWTPKLK